MDKVNSALSPPCKAGALRVSGEKSSSLRCGIFSPKALPGGSAELLFAHETTTAVKRRIKQMKV
jgi:hypothetical protein